MFALFLIYLKIYAVEFKIIGKEVVAFVTYGNTSDQFKVIKLINFFTVRIPYFL